MVRFAATAPPLRRCAPRTGAFVALVFTFTAATTFGADPDRIAIFPTDEAQRGLVESLGLAIEKRVGDSIVVSGVDAEILEGLRYAGIPYRTVAASPVVALRRGPLDVRTTPLRVSDFPAPEVAIPFVVAFDEPLDESSFARVGEAGATVVGPLPPSALLVRGDAFAAARLFGAAGVAGLAPLPPEQRLAPSVRLEPGPQVIDVGGFAGDERIALDAAATLHGRVLERFHHGSRPVVRVEVEGSAVLALAASPAVEWIEGRAQGATYNEKIRVLLQTERKHAAANHDFYNPVYGIGVYGEDQLIAVTDEGILDTHEVFDDGKVLSYYVPANSIATLGDPTGHGTAVSCTAAGDAVGQASGGWGWPNGYDGLALRASLTVQDIGMGAGVNAFQPPPDVIADCLVPAFTDGARVHNNSWGHGPDEFNPNLGFYSMRSYALDEWLKIANNRASVQVFAAGNFGAPWPPANPTYQSYSLSEEAHAKNVITVGGCRNGSERNVMYTYSSRGPTNDCSGGGCKGPGRVKPDMLAPGSGVTSADSWADDAYFGPWFGTSNAAPAISGAAALVRDYFAQGIYPLVPSDPPLGGEPSSALVKAMLVNSTVFLNDATAYLGNAPLGYPVDAYPNFDQGYGRPALDTVLEPAGYRKLKAFEDASTQAFNGSLWTRTIFFKEKWGANCNTLRVSLAWTDKPMTLAASKALVHDLDLEVKYAGTTYLGNFRHTGGTPDELNNVEDVFLPLGTFPVNTLHKVIIRVLGTSVTPLARQNFAVVATYGPCFDNTPCPQVGGCYAGPGDIVPGPNPPSGNGPACEGDHYDLEECYLCGEEPTPSCDPPPGYQPIDPQPTEPHGGG